ncbi:MAG: hypothetical protein RR553_01440 [Akkermansia sp.]
MLRFQCIPLLLKCLRIFLGAFFICIGIAKAFELDVLRADIERFQVVPIGWEWGVAALGIGMELVVGFCFLFRKMYKGAAFLGIAMCTVFVGIFLQGWIRGLSLSCACLGVERPVVSYPLEIAWRLLLLGAMFILLWDSYRENRLFTNVVRLDFRDI